MNESLQQWIKVNNLRCTVVENIATIEDMTGRFLIVEPVLLKGEFESIVDESHRNDIDVRESLFGKDFKLKYNDDNIALLGDDTLNIENFLFEFGDDWFYFKIDSDKTELNPFKYLGKSDTNHDLNFPFLGLHGKYELCNGSRDYKDWAKKAKFYGIDTLGICENQTLAGTYNFQYACKEYGIKPIHGQTAKIQNSKDTFYYAKLYVLNDIGWANMLQISKLQIVTRANHNTYITEQELANMSDGIVIVFNSDVDLDTVNLEVFNSTQKYYQIDPVEWKYDSRDRDYLLLQKKYIDNYLDTVKPVIISDAYYLDSTDYIIKPILNRILNVSHNYQSEDQYFKSCEFLIEQFQTLFNPDDDRLYLILADAMENLENIKKQCTFLITKTDAHLPKYEMNPDEAVQFSNNMDLFYHLIEVGFAHKISGKVEDENIYYERLEKEIEVLTEGKVVDYFLILADIGKWCRDREYLPGLGRGSSAGSLVSFLLGVVDIDPLKYDLLFERFLNKARLLGGSLPDIDFDCPSAQRQEIIQYIIDKYGRDHVAFVGTAQNFKLKSSLKDIAKIKGIDHAQANFLTSLIGKEYDFSKTQGLFELAQKEPKLKELIQKHPDLIQLIELMIFQPRSFGIHAAAVIISPKVDKNGRNMTIYDYLPIRIAEGQLITEWEKEAVEAVGMLKEDMLGLTQLDKIMRMRQLIKEAGITPPDFHEIPLDDKGVFDLFQNAITEDIFQFNTRLQKQYCLDLHPENINDLIAANALCRPGAMENNSHRTYIKIKNGQETSRLPVGLEDILSDTYGVFVYQEQAMLAFQTATKCDLNDADNFRKVITKLKPGKKNPDIEKYEEVFKSAYSKIAGADEAKRVWDMIIGFATYGFNKSHAAAYAITGYWACWYKFHYPVEFYTTALEMTEKEETLKTIISEINDRKLVNLRSPDINKSGTKYSIDRKTNSIYWSLSSIKYVGSVAVEGIIQERTENGLFFSFEEFLSRIEGKKVNTRVIQNLIICGAFDEIESLQGAKDRKTLLKNYMGKNFPEEYQGKAAEQEHYWVLKQKELCGLGDIDFKTIYRSNVVNFSTHKYHSFEDLQDENALEGKATVAGILVNTVERNTRRGTMGQIELDHNGEKVYITAWNDFWSGKEQTFKESKGKIILISGQVKADGFKKMNVLNTTDTSKFQII